MGCTYIKTPISSHGANPIEDLKLIKTYRQILQTVHPDVFLAYTIKPNIYDRLAAKSLDIPSFVNVSDLGIAVERLGILQIITTTLYQFSTRENQKVFFQNVENENFFVKRHIAGGKRALLPGFGVNLNKFQQLPYPSEAGQLSKPFFLLEQLLLKKELWGEGHMSEMEPYKVLHVIGSLHLGGSQAFVMNVYKNIDREKLQFDFVVSPEERKDLYDQVEKMGGRIFVSPCYNGKNHFAYKKWWKHFFEDHPEYRIVHGHVRSTAAIYLKIAKQYGLFTIAHSHSTSNGKGVFAFAKNILQLPIRNVAQYLFACSNEAGKWLYGKKVIYHNNYRVIPNCIDLCRFEYNNEVRESIRTQIGISPNDFVVGHVGRFHKAKNHIFLLKIFEQALARAKCYKLLLVGDGELRAKIEGQVVTMGLFDSVIMVGSTVNPNDYYQAMDCFVFPSFWEGLPMSVVEAQAAGLPCLISNCITKDVMLTNLVERHSLKQKADDWARAIMFHEKEKRVSIEPSEKEKLMPFDTSVVAINLESFYLELANRKQ